jgi:putative transposase
MNLYHIVTRGVDKKVIFRDIEDYLRFIHNLFEFNDEDWVESTYYRFKKFKIHGANNKKQRKRKLLVYIHAFALMPNHYHLLLSPLCENGVSKFMHKINMGYSKYFNKKYKRNGTLYERKYKLFLIDEESHFSYILFYIHLNPLDLFDRGWRRGEIKDYKRAIQFLNSYRWSSHLDYCGIKNFPSVTYRKLFLNFWAGSAEYKKSIIEWLKSLDRKSLSQKQYFAE